MEPVPTLCFAALATWIAFSRAGLQERLNKAVEAARNAKMALAVLDLANTPLQVIESQFSLMELRSQRPPREIPPIRRALTRLRMLSGLLAKYDPAAAPLASLDAEAILRDPLEPRKPLS